MGMYLKIASIFAAFLLISGCESSDETAQVAGTGQAPVAAQPAGPNPGSVQDFQVNVGDRVFFETDKSDIRPDARVTLDRQAAWLRQYPAVRITVEGHADERGTREYNLALGERRANSVRSYLVAQGIDPTRIMTISFGKERPVALGSNEAAWAQNRRAVSVVSGGAPTN